MPAPSLKPPPRADKIWTPLFAGIIFVSMCCSLCSQGSNSALPVYIESIGGPASFSGALNTIFALAAAAGRLFGGGLSDRRGRRLVMLLGAASFFLGSVLPLLFPRLELLALFRVLQGVGFAFTTTAAAAAAADILPPARLGEGIGYYGLGQSLSMAVGPLLSLSLVGWGGARALFSYMSILTTAAFCVSWQCRYSRRAEVAPPRPQAVGKSWSPRRMFEKRAVLPALIQMLFSFGIGAIISFASVLATERGFALPGLFFTAAAASMLLTRLTLGRAIDRYPPRPILIGILAAGCGCFLLIACAERTVVYYAAGLLYGFSYGFSTPLLSSIAVRRSAKHRLGAATATFYLAVDLGVGFGAASWGLLIGRFGYDSAFFGGAVCTALAALLGWFALRGEKSPAEKYQPQTHPPA